MDDDQGELFDADIHYDDSPNASIRFEKDRVDFKPTTDVIVNATAHAPGGIPSHTWQAGIKIGEYESVLQVHGPRHWIRNTLQTPWQLLKAEAVTEVPLRYELAYGGKLTSDSAEDNMMLFDLNPVGLGLVDATNTDLEVPAHQIEHPKDHFNEPNETHYPQGLGFINREWMPRKQLVGDLPRRDIDDLMPPLQAENLLGNQAANVQLVMPSYLAGNEVIVLGNLLSGKSKQTVRLPSEIVYFQSLNRQDKFDKGFMALDTLVIELSDTPHAYISWRAMQPVSSAIKAIKINTTKQAVAEVDKSD